MVLLALNRDERESSTDPGHLPVPTGPTCASRSRSIRGAHFCPVGPALAARGGPHLARAILDRMARHHDLRGTPRPRRRPVATRIRADTFIMRGLSELHLAFTPAG